MGGLVSRLRSEPNHHIKLLILDVVMPHINGDHVFREIHQRAPDVPVLFLTRYDPVTDVPADLLATSTVLAKPCDLNLLLTAVNRLLGAPSGRHHVPSS